MSKSITCFKSNTSIFNPLVEYLKPVKRSSETINKNRTTSYNPKLQEDLQVRGYMLNRYNRSNRFWFCSFVKMYKLKVNIISAALISLKKYKNQDFSPSPKFFWKTNSSYSSFLLKEIQSFLFFLFMTL